LALIDESGAWIIGHARKQRHAHPTRKRLLLLVSKISLCFFFSFEKRCKNFLPLHRWRRDGRAWLMLRCGIYRNHLDIVI